MESNSLYLNNDHQYEYDDNDNDNELPFNDFEYESDITINPKQLNNTNSNNENKRIEKEQKVKQIKRNRTRIRQKQKKADIALQHYLSTINMSSNEKKAFYDDLKCKRKAFKQSLRSALESSFHIIFDFDYAIYMKDEHTRSLIRQLADCYGLNKRNKVKICYHLTNYNSIKTELFKMGGNYWHCKLYEDEFYKCESIINLNKQFVYLSPDADEEIDDVDDAHVYIVGGFVDKPVIKNKSMLRVKQITTENTNINIVCRRLPLWKYVDNLINPVLNVNTVCEILSYKRDGVDWVNAINQALPGRMSKKE